MLLAASLQSEATQAALLSQNERNALVARVQMLHKENQRHVELEAQLMARVKLLEHAVWQLRKKCGEEAGAEPSKEASVAVAAAKKRQHSRRALLVRLLQENGVEAAGNLAGIQLPTEYEPKHTPPATPVVAVAAPPAVAVVAPVVATSGLDELQALARTVALAEDDGAAQREKKEQEAEAKRAQQQREAEQKKKEQEEEEMMAKSLGVDASKMMKRMQGGTPVRRKGPGAAQLVAAALGAAPSSSRSSSGSSTAGFGSPGPSVQAAVKWAASHTLRSHLDVVRGVAFHRTRPLVATCSDDWTVRLFNVGENKKKGANVDCVWTYRGHTGPVLAVECSPSGDLVFSAGIDGSIVSWSVPSGLEKGKEGRHGDMAAYRAGVRPDAHDDAVWGLCCGSGLLLSHGADEMVRLWSLKPCGDAALSAVKSNGRIVGADLMSASQFVVATATASAPLVCWDVEADKAAATMGGEGGAGTCSGVRCVPELSVLVTSHADSKVCLWDTRAPAMTASFVAHTAAVSCVDASPGHIVTGSGDAVRLWDMGTRACISDFVAHRKKFDQGVTTLRLSSPSSPAAAGPMFASGAGDGIAKVFSQQ